MGHSLTIESDEALALAKSPGEPLLFEGDDVPRTDITPALT